MKKRGGGVGGGQTRYRYLACISAPDRLISPPSKGRSDSLFPVSRRRRAPAGAAMVTQGSPLLRCNLCGKHLKTRTPLHLVGRLPYRYLRQQAFRTTSRGKASGGLRHCVDSVRKFDYENFVCTLLYPGTIRTAAFAIRAFNVEVAQIKDLVTDPKIGLMRLHFWRDTLDHIYGGTSPETPVATELATAIEKHSLSKHWFVRIIDAREEHMIYVPYRTMTHAEEYAEKTASSIYYLLLECFDLKKVQIDHVASHIGKAQGIVTLLRSTPYHTSKRQVYLPLDILMKKVGRMIALNVLKQDESIWSGFEEQAADCILKHGVSQEAIFRQSPEMGVRDVIYDIASVAHQHLNTAKSLKKDVPMEVIPIFVNTVVCEQYLSKLQALDFDVFHPKLRQKDNLLPARLWLRKMKRTY